MFNPSIFMYLYEFFYVPFPRLQQLDEENSELRSCVPCLRANIERLEEVRTINGFRRGLFAVLVDSTDCQTVQTLLMRPHLFVILQEKRKLQDETEAMSDRLSDEMESRKKMADKLSHERHQNQKEKEATQEVRQPVAVEYFDAHSGPSLLCAPQVT